MKPEMMYEEAEVRRTCRLAATDGPYWDQITSEHSYAKFTGLTEKGTRLWGKESEIKWAIENITGFRPAI
jgi:hypothetical protein